VTATLVDATGPIARVLDRLPEHKRSGDGWVAHCPAHEDKRQSLSVKVGRDGRVLLHCHANCATRDVVEAMGLTWQDVFADAPSASARNGTSRGGQSRIVATYDYVDAEGELLYQVVRKEPKDFRQRRPDGKGGWTWSLGQTTRVLYHLPAVLAAVQAHRTVFVAEGEKDVHTLEQQGVVATTHAGGAGKWQDAFSRTLAGTHVVLLPDNDEPGRQHMRAVARSVIAAGAKTVRIVELPDLPPKGDVSDWFGDGHTMPEFTALVKGAGVLTLDDVTDEPGPAEEAAPPEPPVNDHDAGTTDHGPRAMFRCTDLGNGERLVHAHGQDLAYVATLKRWYRWDGRRWARDTTRTIEQLAKEVIRTIPAEASRAPSAEMKAAIEAWGRKSESRPRVVAMIASAESDRQVAIEHGALDAEPWLLATEHGVLDLRTGEVRGHQRSDYITKLVPIAYDADATAPRWHRFLNRIMDGNEDLVGFLQRAVGYSLTGSTREQVLFFLHGSGANGKSTFLEILRALVGDYATQADFATFLERRSDGPRNDVARLVGSRVVTSSEVGEGKRLDEGLVKSLTGSDTIAARLLYSEAFEFRPQFKLWLAANHKPVIRGTDHAIWRRVRLIPFAVEIPEAEQDPDLVPALKHELPGILAWAVQGCLDWQEYGLQPPDAVIAATDDYRRESDVLGAFLDACCLMGEQYATSASVLYQAYKHWAGEGGEYVLSQTAFGRRLTERGITATKSGHSNSAMRVGVALNPAATEGPESHADSSSNRPHNPPHNEERFL
jgi:putative DNA primase/helicase